MKTEKHIAGSGGKAGVTLIEMMVVVTIIALFIALVAPKMFKRADEARITAARAQMSNFSTALGMYKLDTSTFPTTEQGLQALRVAPDATPLWKGPYSAAGRAARSVGPSIYLHVSR